MNDYQEKPLTTTTTSNGTGWPDALIVLGIFASIAFAVLVVVGIYVAIFASALFTICLGWWLGSLPYADMPWNVRTPSIGHQPYHRVMEIEATKREHLKALEGESEELQALVEGHFEDQKLALYRPPDDTHLSPRRELVMEFAKASMGHIAARMFKKDK
jgi:hypothetical protein